MTTIIKIENLSKKYVIGHQRQESYSTLRDVMMHKIRGIGERLRHPLSPNREKTTLEEFWALKDINFEIKQGDRVGIIGRNGAGKSTLLKILSRITEPTTGRIKIKGRVASLLEVGTGFHPELTGRENIFLNGAILGMSRVDIKKNFDEIVAFAEIEKFLDTPVKRYSSGMYVRLAFAVAAHLEPEILLVDEVLAVGDVAFQKKCLGKMGDVAKGGRTILFVSHNMGALNKLCPKAILLSEGKVSGQGPTENIICRYLSTAQKTTNTVSFPLETGKKVQITRIRIANKRSISTNVFDSYMPIFIEITYTALKSLDHHRVSLKIISTVGDVIFTTTNVDEAGSSLPLSPGTYLAKLEIPSRLLASGTYIVNCYIGQPNVETYDRQENAISFEIEGSPYKISEHREGFLSYKFRWDSRQLEQT